MPCSPTDHLRIEVVYDDPVQGQVRCSLFDAAFAMWKVTIEAKGTEWVAENKYDLDRALADYLVIHFGWLEMGSQRLVRQAD